MSTDQNETVIQRLLRERAIFLEAGVNDKFIIGKLSRQRDALLEALNKIAAETSDKIAERDARAAIASVEEKKE